MQQKLPLMDALSRKLAELLKDSPAKDLEANLRAGLSGLLGKLDVVTREQFDVQAEVLQRTKTDMARLEARLAELEERFKSSHAED
ncbi:MAG: accessory factor UbiK family protein [Thiobacillaceae bacterium]